MPIMSKGNGTERRGALRPWAAAVLLALLAAFGWLTERQIWWSWNDLHEWLDLPLTALQPADGEIGVTAVTFLDVGQGDAVLLQSGGQNCLIDTGPASSAQELLQGLYLREAETLEYLVLTHPDADHIGGALSVLRQFSVSALLVPFDGIDPDASGWQDDIYEEAARQGIPVTAVTAGQTYPLGEGTLTVLLADHGGAQASTNDRSLCLRFAAGEFSFLDTGDAERETEAELVRQYGDSLRSTLMKAGHHGSSTSNTMELLRAVQPQAVGVSCGADNDYGHPHREALANFAAAGAAVYRTDQLGSITFIYDAEGLHLPGEEIDDGLAAA